MKKETVNDELRDLSPTLHEQHKRGKGSMNVPEDYFDNLEDRVFARLEQEGALRIHPAPMRVWYSRRNLLMAAASVVLLLAAGTWWIIGRSDDPEIANVQKPELSAEDVEAYVLQNIHEFEAEQLAVLTPETQPTPPRDSKTQPRQGDQRPAVPDLSEEELENILLDMSDEELEKLLL